MFEWLRRKRPDKEGFVRFSARELSEPLGVTREIEFEALRLGINPDSRKSSQHPFETIVFPPLHDDGDNHHYYMQRTYSTTKDRRLVEMKVSHIQGNPLTPQTSQSDQFTFVPNKKETKWDVLNETQAGTHYSPITDQPNSIPDRSAKVLSNYLELLRGDEPDVV